MSTFWEEKGKKRTTLSQVKNRQTASIAGLAQSVPQRTMCPFPLSPTLLTWNPVPSPWTPAADSATGLPWPASVSALKPVHVCDLLFQWEPPAVLISEEILFDGTEPSISELKSLQRSQQLRSPMQHPRHAWPRLHSNVQTDGELTPFHIFCMLRAWLKASDKYTVIKTWRHTAFHQLAPGYWAGILDSTDSGRLTLDPPGSLSIDAVTSSPEKWISMVVDEASKPSKLSDGNLNALGCVSK